MGKVLFILNLAVLATIAQAQTDTNRYYSFGDEAMDLMNAIKHCPKEFKKLTENKAEVVFAGSSLDKELNTTFTLHSEIGSWYPIFEGEKHGRLKIFKKILPKKNRDALFEEEEYAYSCDLFLYREN